MSFFSFVPIPRDTISSSSLEGLLYSVSNHQLFIVIFAKGDENDVVKIADAGHKSDLTVS